MQAQKRLMAPAYSDEKESEEHRSMHLNLTPMPVRRSASRFGGMTPLQTPLGAPQVRDRRNGPVPRSAADLGWPVLGGSRFWDVSPHPFWIIILLLSVQYGTREGLMAAACSSCALLAGNLPVAPITQDLYSYYSKSAGIRCYGSLLPGSGEIRQRHIRERDELRHRLIEANRNEEFIAASHDRLNRIKEKLETRLAAQMKSLITVYETAKDIERLEEAELLAGVINVVRSAMNPNNSRSTCSRLRLEALFAGGWSDDARYAASFTANAAVRAGDCRQRVVCCARPEDEEALRGRDAGGAAAVHRDR